MYKIIDKTPNKILSCAIQRVEGPIAGEIIGNEREIEVGDMFWIRDSLASLGYKLWQDFDIKKME